MEELNKNEQNLESPYSLMNFNELEKDPTAGPILQKKCLEYLKTQDKEWFEQEYTGELDEEGCLIPRSENGGHSTFPSQNITAGIPWVEEETKKELKLLESQN